MAFEEQLAEIGPSIHRRLVPEIGDLPKLLAHALVVDLRITSYNVCYTKLLRYPNAQPGDFKWHDTDGDGQITPNDRTMLGNPWPKWTYGISLNAKWKGLDFSMFMHGKADVDVWSAQYRTEGYGRSNLPDFSYNFV